MKITVISVSKITPSSLVRRSEMKNIEELAQSIHEHGLIHPLQVFQKGKKPEHTYELIAGERRFRAIESLGWEEVPVVIQPKKKARELQILENFQREDLHPYEEALMLSELAAEKDLQEISAMVHIAVNRIRQRMKLLRLSPDAVQAFYHDSKISIGAAQLMAVMTHKDQDEFLVSQAKTNRIGADDVESFLKRHVFNSLSDATFDIESEKLHPPAGSCITCPKMGKNNPDLFDHHNSEMLCYDAKCYAIKREIQFEADLIACKTHGIPLISWIQDQSTRDLLAQGYVILDDNDFRDVGEEGKDTLKAMYVDSWKRGRFTNILLNKKSANRTKLAESLDPAEYAKAEEQRLLAREARAVELDREKATSAMVEMLESFQEYSAYSNDPIDEDLASLHLITLLYFIINSTRWDVAEYLRKLVLTELDMNPESDFTPQVMEQFYQMVESNPEHLYDTILKITRYLVVNDIFSNGSLDPEGSISAWLVHRHAWAVDPEQCQQIEDKLAEKKEKRLQRLQEKLDALLPVKSPD